MQINNWKIGIIASLVICSTLLLIGLNLSPTSTGDAGDSITHYLYSRYAFVHPEFFFHHWAKPVFVLLSSPFAQIGFKGIIVFNILCATLSALLTYLVAKELEIKRALLIFLLIFFSPLYFQLIFSGLTEYLFGLMLIFGVFLWIKKHSWASLILISFLPLVRSEGLLILVVFAAFLILYKHWRLIPFLLFGQFIYSIIGGVFYNDFLWIVSDIPYINLGSPYGKGQLMDFVFRLNYVIEKPIFALLGLGVLSILFHPIQNIKVIYLILSLFGFYFLAHSLFWWLGIFNSMGLPRVLIAIVPLIAIIALLGINWLTSFMKNRWSIRIVTVGIAILIVVFPFTYRQFGVVFNNELFAIEENILIEDELTPYLHNEFPNHENAKFYYSHPYISLALQHDFFDNNTRNKLKFLSYEKVTDNTIVIWDDWFSTIEENYPIDSIPKKAELTLNKKFFDLKGNRVITFAVFSKSAK